MRPPSYTTQRPAPRRTFAAYFSQLLGIAHPVALSASWLVAVFASTGTPLWGLWRPLVVVVLAVLVLQTVVTVAIRRPMVAALLTSGLVMSAAPVWAAALPIFASFAWLGSVNLLRTRRRRQQIPMALLGRLSMNVGLVSLVLLSLAIGQAATGGAFWIGARQPAVTGAMRSMPDVYIVLLDGYPRSDVLGSTFNIDNTWFTSELERRGFEVAEHSRSNYSITWLTVASMFQMDYVQDLPEMRPLPIIGPEQYRVLGQLLNAAPVLSDLHERGYRIVSSASAFSDIALTNADTFLDTVGPNRFEEQVLEKSTITTVFNGIIGGWLAAKHREAIDTSLDRLGTIATRADPRPVFMFDHVFSPHPPFVVNADGSLRSLQDCFPRSCSLDEPTLGYLHMTLDQYQAGLQQQIAYLNRKTIDAIDGLIRARPDAVLVLFSDHGTRYDKLNDPTEAVSNFFAARTPGIPGAFADDVSPVNVLAILMNQYMGTQYPMRPFRSWLSFQAPKDLRPIYR